MTTTTTIEFTLWHTASNRAVTVQLTKALPPAEALLACMKDLESKELANGHTYMYLADGSTLAAVML